MHCRVGATLSSCGMESAASEVKRMSDIKSETPSPEPSDVEKPQQMLIQVNRERRDQTSSFATRAPRDDNSESSPQRAFVAAAVRRRLIGDAGVIGAIGQARYRLAAAEEGVGA